MKMDAMAENKVLKERLKMGARLYRKAIRENVRLLRWKGKQVGLTRNELKTLVIGSMVLGHAMPRRSVKGHP